MNTYSDNYTNAYVLDAVKTLNAANDAAHQTDAYTVGANLDDEYAWYTA